MTATLILMRPREQTIAPTPETRTVILWCKCGKYHEITVTLRDGCPASCTQPPPHDEPRLDYELPDNCACGAMVDTYQNCLDVEDTAELLFTQGYPAGAA